MAAASRRRALEIRILKAGTEISSTDRGLFDLQSARRHQEDGLAVPRLETSQGASGAHARWSVWWAESSGRGFPSDFSPPPRPGSTMARASALARPSSPVAARRCTPKAAGDSGGPFVRQNRTSAASASCTRSSASGRLPVRPRASRRSPGVMAVRVASISMVREYRRTEKVTGGKGQRVRGERPRKGKVHEHGGRSLDARRFASVVRGVCSILPELLTMPHAEGGRCACAVLRAGPHPWDNPCPWEHTARGPGRLHVHTRYSGWRHLRFIHPRDCYSEPRAVYDAALARGMRFVAITDDNAIEGALRLLDQPGVDLALVIAGEEAEPPFPKWSRGARPRP